MNVRQCDNCGWIIPELKEGYGLTHGLARIEICDPCAKPIIELIAEKQLLLLDLVRQLQNGSREPGENLYI